MGRGGTARPGSYAYSWSYDQYQGRRVPPDRGDHRRRPAPALVGRGQGPDRGREPGPGDDRLGGGAALRAAPEPALRLAAATRGTGGGGEGPGFVPVVVAEDTAATSPEMAGRIEIALGPAVMRVGPDVDAAALTGSAIVG